MVRRLDNQRGSVLLLVLVIIALVSALLVELSFSTRVDLRLTETFRDSTQAYYLAKGGLEVGKAFISNDQPLNVDAFPVEENFISVHTRDLGGKLNLNSLVGSDGINPNAVAMDRFIRLFELLGMAPDEIDERIDALIDWIDIDDIPRPLGAENAHYLGLEPPLQSKNAPLDRLDELRQVRGFTPELIGELRPHVTVYGDALNKVNLNVASAEVLMALSEDIDDAAVEALVEAREAEPLAKSADLNDLTGLTAAARSALAVNGNYVSRHFELETRAEVNDGRRTLIAVIEKNKRTPLYLRMQ